jgi:hypothetical protein
VTIAQFDTILDDFYQHTLTDAQAADLLNTSIHESVHYTSANAHAKASSAVRERHISFVAFRG